jgi:hypothetical protein
MKKEKLLRRIRTLCILEFFNAFFLPWVFIRFASGDQQIGLVSITSMVLNAILLLEGSYLWFSVYRRLNGAEIDALGRVFQRIRIINLVLIILSLGIIIFYPFVSSGDKIGAIIFFALATLEHINYFEIQLMYDNANDIKHLLKFGFKPAKLKMIIKR